MILEWPSSLETSSNGTPFSNRSTANVTQPVAFHVAVALNLGRPKAFRYISLRPVLGVAFGLTVAAPKDLFRISVEHCEQLFCYFIGNRHRDVPRALTLPLLTLRDDAIDALGFVE